jgi:steroid delta-isomerase-like uncharacterized protein
MTNEQNKAIPRRFFKAMETNDQTAMKELLAPYFKAYHFGSPDPISREELLMALSMYEGAFSNQKYTIIDQVAEGDRVTTRTTWEATHSGEYEGLPPTGKRVLVSGIAVSRIKDGQIVERWLEVDRLGWLQQLGLVPLPQPSG